MFAKKSIFRAFSILLILLMLSGTASASTLNAPLGTGFTYQGKLTDGGSPANGTYDFEFKLYDALSGGSPVGSTVTQGDVTVTAGLFTVQLDFGNVFDGTALYLEIGVRPGISTGTYTVLTPRQQLTATPYAIYALKVPWSGISGMPAGFADGVDNSGASYQNIKVVAKSGGDFTTITAALDSITDASDTNRYLIYVAPGIYSEQVTMKEFVDIEGAGELTTKITFTGSAGYDTGTLIGADNTELRFLTVENTGSAAYAIAIYNESAASRLTHVSASASGGGMDNYGVYNSNLSSPMTMTDVTAIASGGTGSYGVWNVTSSPTIMNSPTMTNVTATASGGSNENVGVKNTGYYLSITTSPTMTNVTATASGESNNFGVLNENSSPTMMNVTATASGGAGSSNIGIENWYSSSPTMTNVIATASGGDYSTGVDNQDFSSPTMTNVTATSSGGTSSNSGVNNQDSSSTTMTNVTATGSGGTYSYGVENSNSSSSTINNSVISASGGTNNWGINNGNTATVRVNNSQISGSSNTIKNAAGATAFVGASQLNGGAVQVGSAITCIGVYSASYVALNSTCQ